MTNDILNETKELISNYLEYYPGPPIHVEIFFNLNKEHMIVLSSFGYESTYWLNSWLPAALKWFDGKISLVEYLLNRPDLVISDLEIEQMRYGRKL